MNLVLSGLTKDSQVGACIVLPFLSFLGDHTKINPQAPPQHNKRFPSAALDNFKDGLFIKNAMNAMAVTRH